MKGAITDNLRQKAIKIAQQLQLPQQSSRSTVFEKRIGPLLATPKAKTFLIRLMDTAFRSSNRSRIAAFVYKIIKRDENSNKVFTSFEKILISLYKFVGRHVPNLSIPLMLEQVKSVTSDMLFFVGSKKLKKHLIKRTKKGVRLNVNLIGEALIGEREAAERIEKYCQLLEDKNINYISIKASTIYSQIKPIAFEQTVDVVVKKLALIYDKVLELSQQSGEQKFVNLDMEEYRDLAITLEVFMRTLELPRFQKLRAGIVLQAYLPESYMAAQKLQKWALERTRTGGSPVKVRLVKGANLEMEKTEASLESWPLATYGTKLQVDANYKRILLVLLQADKATSLQVGIASHNLFDIGFGLALVEMHQLKNVVDFEMLEGMANETVKTLIAQGVNVLLYTPIVASQNYNSAIAYLVRRLDEGTQDGNFLKEGYQLKVNDEKWHLLRREFENSLMEIGRLHTETYRVQDRNSQMYAVQNIFKNSPNTDWCLAKNREWIGNILGRWQNPLEILGAVIPIVPLATSKREELHNDYWQGTTPWKYQLANEKDYEAFINSSSEWEQYSTQSRVAILRQAAVNIEKQRGDLIAVALEELGKTVVELDVEVSEAVDFANYYAASIETIETVEKIHFNTGGIQLVLSPWNFPIAIPIGGVLASLAAGKRVILKPSLNATATAYLIAKTLWDAGVPESAFAFFPADEIILDNFLKKGTVFDAVILTGATDTAQFLLKRNPQLKLYAETGGKNATFVSALADREQAIKNVVQSAFGNTGQKCSATSLLLLEAEVFEDPHFKQLLKDAAESKVFGNPKDLATDIGPLAVKTNARICDVLRDTPERKWLLKPKIYSEYEMSPGIIWDVKPGAKVFKTELFGPILSVAKVANIDEAVTTVNNLKYGLTSGIESLDTDEIDYWMNTVKVGNIYANRTTTGAVVKRQPFGGMKASSYGFGMKAGGPNYLLQFIDVVEPNWNTEALQKNYLEAYYTYFSQKTDDVQLRGQHNYNMYLKPKKIILLLDKNVLEWQLFAVNLIAEILQVPIEFFAIDAITNAYKIHKINSWECLIRHIKPGECIRALGCKEQLPVEFLNYCLKNNFHIYGNPISKYGRIEFLNYLTEQNQSINYHRYGNLMGENV